MSADREILLVYDNECPACNFYCELARIDESVGKLTLVNAREHSDTMDKITAAGLDIDQGMVLMLDDQIYYGAEAIQMLSLLSTRIGVFNRLSYHVFRSKRVASVLYPMLRTCRNLLLKLLRKSKINNLAMHNNIT